MSVKPRGYLRARKLGLVELYSKVVIGATGAVSSQTDSNASGFTVSRSTTGRYDILTSDTWAEHWHLSVLRFNNGTAKGANIELYDKYGATTAKTLTFSVVNDAGAEEDPASSDELWIKLTMSNTAVGP